MNQIKKKQSNVKLDSLIQTYFRHASSLFIIKKYRINCFIVIIINYIFIYSDNNKTF